jgi:uncharacterized protein DUF4037
MRARVRTFDWLATPGQRLAEAVGGAVFHDGLGELGPLRERLSWYPVDVWTFLMAGLWQRIAQEEAFPGRCAEVGDDLGARVVTTRLVRDLMRLTLLMEHRYAPYSKWLGSAFSASPSGPVLGPLLHGALTASRWADREAHLTDAYRLVAGLHNRLGLTEPMDESTRDYYGRPYQVIDGGRFVRALRSRLTGSELAALPPVGNVDQFIDSTDVLMHPPSARAVASAVLGPLDR